MRHHVAFLKILFRPCECVMKGILSVSGAVELKITLLRSASAVNNSCEFFVHLF